MKEGYAAAPLWGVFGLIIGAWAGNRLGYGRCGEYGAGYPGAYVPGFAGACAPGYGPGYGGFHDRPRHEDRQDERLACLEGEVMAQKVAIKKDEKIAALEDRIVRGDLSGLIFRETCMKPNGKVYLQPNHLADPYNSEPRFIDAHGFRENRENRGFCDESWY